MQELIPEEITGGHKPVFLVGYMCSGKTTLGRAVCRVSRRHFIDLDVYIENRFHMSVSEIFARRGEDEFRRLERMMLREVGEFEDVIVACGGGTPCFFDNMEYMNQAGLTVMLDCPRARLHARLCAGRRKRPLIARLSDDELDAFIDEALAKRMPYYSKARHVFDSGELESEEEISRTTEKFLRLIGESTNQNT